LSGIIMSQSNTFIIGPVAKLLGLLMNLIFNGLYALGAQNSNLSIIGLSIIIFTIVIYMALLPLTIQQQKFAKLQTKMNPELQAIQSKYKDKKDNDSMMAMNMETKAVYAKYGVSPSGSCLQLAIQMPILWALYKVIDAMPAYVTKIKAGFFPLVDKLIAVKGSSEVIKGFKGSSAYSKMFSDTNFTSGVTSYVQNTYIDCLNKATSTDWATLVSKYPNLKTDILHTEKLLDTYNNFLGLNMGNSPSFSVHQGISTGSVALIIGAIMIPVLSALTQYISVKLMPQPDNKPSGNEQADAMANSMKSMNVMMPIMSAVFCYTLPAGMGLYWIAGAVIRSIQQIFINRHIDKMDFAEVIKKNEAKAKKKMEKAGVNQQRLAKYADINTKTVSSRASERSNISEDQKQKAIDKATAYYSKGTKEGSIASKANMVKKYNEKSNK
jgi:YidC/Oxa1 family membrane protein insertase